MKLNDYNEKTKNVIHLLVTTMCDRNCKHCCNKQIDLNQVPYVTRHELSNCETICITGGEPFAYSNPVAIARKLKRKYKNIKNVYVYTNAIELYDYIKPDFDINQKLDSIDGLSIGIKCEKDSIELANLLSNRNMLNYMEKSSIRIYVADNIYYTFMNFSYIMRRSLGVRKEFEVHKRTWQEDFKPCEDSIWRKI